MGKRWSLCYPNGYLCIFMSMTFLVAQRVKHLPEMLETWVQSLGGEDLLEKGTATHSNILAWRISMDRGAWQATIHVLQRVGGH